MTEVLFRSPRKHGRIAIFLSGRGSNFRAIHDAAEAGRIDAGISLVFSDKKEAPGLQTAEQRGLTAIHLNPKAFPSREAYEAALGDEVEALDIDLICLAGYMKILGDEFCRRFQHRILNIHPALLPSFPGLHVQRKALDWGVRFSGATVHFVIPEVDMGPIVLQAVVPVEQDDTEDTLSERILREEHRIYPEAVQLYFEGRLEIRGRRVFVL